MQKSHLIVSALFLLTAFNCSKSKQDGCAGSATTFQLNEPFILCWGSTASQAGQPDFTIKFEDLVEESRCPTDVICIQAGRASVSIVLHKATEGKSDTLSLGDYFGTAHSDSTTFGTYKIKLLEVLPAPVSTAQTPEEEYKVKLLITN